MKLNVLAHLLGVIAILIGWTAIIISMVQHPWFSIYRNALSDLGAIGIPSNSTFNVGLMMASLFALAYGCNLMLRLRRPLGLIGGALFFLTSIFLMLVALFPEGTKPHYMVSVMFFLLLIVSMMLLSIMVITLNRSWGLMHLVLSLLALIFAFLPWPSIGMLEVSILIVATLWLIIFAMGTLRGIIK